MKIASLAVAVLLATSILAGCSGGPGPTPSVIGPTQPAATQPAGTPTTTATPPSIGSPTAGFFLTVTSPLNESVVTTGSVRVEDKAAPDAVVSVDGVVAALDAEGNFALSVTLRPGPNAIDVVASDFQGNQKSLVINVIYNV